MPLASAPAVSAPRGLSGRQFFCRTGHTAQQGGEGWGGVGGGVDATRTPTTPRPATKAACATRTWDTSTPAGGREQAVAWLAGDRRPDPSARHGGRQPRLLANKGGRGAGWRIRVSSCCFALPPSRFGTWQRQDATGSTRRTQDEGITTCYSVRHHRHEICQCSGLMVLNSAELEIMCLGRLAQNS